MAKDGRPTIQMTTRSHSLNVIALMALFVMISVGLASCGGGGSKAAPGNTGDQIIIEPRPSQDSPDLTVVSPSGSHNNPAAGASFTLPATVSNAGDGESAATTLRYYRSTDGTITTSDTEVGTAAVAGLAASGSDSQSVELVAPSVPGTYHYGACVDAVAVESDTTNNCSTAVQVTVPAPERPDLTIVSSSVSNNSPTVGSPFTLSATVQNDGNGESVATTLRYYRSADGTITTSDTEVGTDAVAGLAASGSDSQSVELVAPSAPGTHHYGACVDAVAGESDTANNCSTAVQITVPVPERPNLTIVSSSVSNNSPTVGSQFTLSAMVNNAGGGESAASTLRYFRSADSTITTSDTEVGTNAVAGLAPSGSGSQSVDLTAPSAPGTYYYGACVDAVAGESDTANNCSTAVEVTVVVTQLQIQGSPDLEVGTPTVSDTSPETRTSFTLSATVRNAGDRESVPTTLRYYRSTDAMITTADDSVGTKPVAQLAEVGSRSESVPLTAPTIPGTYYYGACVDAVAGESNRTNNCSTAVEVTVLRTERQQLGQPNLELGTPTVDDASPDTSAPFTLSATVSNTGDGEAPATTLRYYRSTDATIMTSDTEVGRDDVGVLLASGTSAESISLTAPSTAGTYYYGGCVDAVAGESNRTNNCSTAVGVTVSATALPPISGPNLEVGTPTVDDASPEISAPFTLSATVSNTGNRDSAATTLRFYRSRNLTIETTDTLVGSVVVGTLAASGGNSNVMLSLTAPSTAGTYYYGACVDEVAGESDTTDNCTQSLALTVDGPPPDLVVLGPNVSEIRADRTFWLIATVHNQGSGGSAATTVRYKRSTDGTITTSDTTVGTDAVTTRAPSTNYAATISLTAPSGPGTYYYGACVDEVPSESDTTNNCSPSVEVTVLQTLQQQVQPDLVVGSPTVSDDGPGPGGSFTLSATVSNTGDGESPATTLRYYRSEVATITTAATAVGADGRWCALGGGDQRGIDLADGAVGPRDVLLRRLRGRGGGRVEHHEQLLALRRGHGAADVAAAGSAGPGRRVADGERQQPNRRDEFPPVGDGEEQWRWGVAGDDAPLLPLRGCDDRDHRHGGRVWQRWRAVCVGDEREVVLGDGAGDGGHLLLRCMHCRSDGRARHERHLLRGGAGGCRRTAGWNRLGCGFVQDERRQSGDGRVYQDEGDCEQQWRR